MWIKILSKQTVESGGHPQQYNSGDFVDVTRKTAMRLIAARLASDPDPETSQLLPLNAGVLFQDGIPAKYLDVMTDLYGVVGDVPWHKHDTLTLDFQFNLVLDANWGGFNVHRMPIGFALLDTWELAVAIEDYDILIVDIVPSARRAELTERLFDLRVPALLPEFFYIKRTPTTEALVEKFVDYQAVWGKSIALSLAIFETKPFWLTLPVTWANATGHDPYEKEH